jgi:hypothetical protein
MLAIFIEEEPHHVHESLVPWFRGARLPAPKHQI